MEREPKLGLWVNPKFTGDAEEVSEEDLEDLEALRELCINAEIQNELGNIWLLKQRLKRAYKIVYGRKNEEETVIKARELGVL
jgi:hypothetical protein